MCSGRNVFKETRINQPFVFNLTPIYLWGFMSTQDVTWYYESRPLVKENHKSGKLTLDQVFKSFVRSKYVAEIFLKSVFFK